jgi:hypothetical protein
VLSIYPKGTSYRGPALQVSEAYAEQGKLVKEFVDFFVENLN